MTQLLMTPWARCNAAAAAGVSAEGLSIINSLTDLETRRIQLSAPDAACLEALHGLTQLSALEIGMPMCRAC
jgi:hypothetical protein